MKYVYVVWNGGIWHYGSSSEVPTATVPADPSFRPDEYLDPNFRSDVQGDGSVDSGTTVSLDGDTVDSVAVTNDDSGFDPTDPDDAFCHSAVTKTCEQRLHCCMKVCKTLHSGTTLPSGVGVHVECVNRCAEAHKKCVRTVGPSDCNK